MYQWRRDAFGETPLHPQMMALCRRTNQNTTIASLNQSQCTCPQSRRKGRLCGLRTHSPDTSGQRKKSPFIRAIRIFFFCAAQWTAMGGEGVKRKIAIVGNFWLSLCVHLQQMFRCDHVWHWRSGDCKRNVCILQITGCAKFNHTF